MDDKIVVSQEWLERLRGELKQLEERRNRLGQELRQVEAQILAQTGAVGLMQELLRTDTAHRDGNGDCCAKGAGDARREAAEKGWE